MRFRSTCIGIAVLYILATGALFAAQKGEPSPTTADFNKAYAALIAQNYPRNLLNYFCSLGTNPDLGFRWAGTTAERAVGLRVEKEMRAMGLSNVRREPVPVDVFEFRRASVKVGDRIMIASTLAGVPPTPSHGITAPVVYVKGGTAADFAAAGDVAGKLVLVDNMPSKWWPCWPALEAGHRKALGVICTFTPDDPKYYAFNDQTLGSFDGSYDFSAPSWVYIARRDGDWLKAQMKNGAVTAALTLDQTVTRAQEGGTAYNVIGEIPGTSRDGQVILFAAHQDAHFRAAIDDTSGLVNMLAIARAMRESGYRPKHTLLFLATAAEEFGYTDTNYEFLIGSWWAIGQTHKDWAGRMRAMLNLEGMGYRGSRLGMMCNPELKPWLEQLCAENTTLLPFKEELSASVNSWNDQWPFTASGIPSVVFEASVGDYTKIYHTNFDTPDKVDWSYVESIAKFLFLAVQRLDENLLPYSLKARADDLTAAIKKEDLLAAGANATIVTRLTDGIASFQGAAATYDAGANAIPADRIETVNRRLLAIEKILNRDLTALAPPDDLTVYPHQYVFTNLQGVNAALSALKTAKPDAPTAMKALLGTGETAIGIVFSDSVFQKMIARRGAGYPRLNWAVLGKLPASFNVMPEYRKIEKGDIAGAIAGLEHKRTVLLRDLNQRLAKMASILKTVTPMVKELH